MSDLALVHSDSLSLSSGSVLPSLSNLGAYVRFVNSIPVLDEDREAFLFKRLADNSSVEAAKELVLSHLRLVVKIAKEHSGYGLAQEDLIQEGNVGLMKAVRKFDPAKKVRLAAYAAIWIKSEIQEYILSNWRTVKIGSSKGLRKLFFNLRRLQSELFGVSRLDQRNEVAKLLGVEPEEVDKAIEWFTGGDLPLAHENSSDESNFEIMSLPAPSEYQPHEILDQKQSAYLLPSAINELVRSLSDRERRVIEARYLSGDQASTLSDLAKELGVSVERVRQIEVSALSHMRKARPDMADLLDT